MIKSKITNHAKRQRAKVLAIIVTWNKKKYVVNLLHSLANIEYPPKKLDILVVDNASTDGTVATLDRLFGDDITILRNPENIGGTGGFNTGLAWAFEQPESDYDYLWLLDNDVLVHKNALAELVATLEQNPDAAICGSTMLQLDFPWRINEMGSFVNLQRGVLQFHRHFEEVPGWHHRPVRELLQESAYDLSRKLPACQPAMDVDYVAAASLLIRVPIAKQAGLWMDFFIHFDDVEWCLRIAHMGHRIMVSARSLIWHVSAIAKIPSWILYYDNRNILYVLDKYSTKRAIKSSMRWTLEKAVYYSLLGKQDLAKLHREAVKDFKARVTGKKDLKIAKIQSNKEIKTIFAAPEYKRILVPWTINLQATNLQSELIQAMRQRPDLKIYYLAEPLPASALPLYPLPGAIPLHLSHWLPLRLLKYLRWYRHFDLVLQSDYQPLLACSWLGRNTLFVNDETFCLREKPRIRDLLVNLASLIRHG